jgi:hypothetical protein
MPKKLDYRAVWVDARALFAAHKEAMVPIAGFFIFMSAWISAFFVPALQIATLGNTGEMMVKLSGYFEAHWPILLPTMLVTMYGSLSLYVLLSGRILAKVGDVFAIAGALFVPYVLASIIVGWSVLAGLFLFVIPGLYLAGRFSVMPAIIAQENGGGIAGSIRQAWQVTSKCGWAVLILMLFVTVVVRLFAGIAGGVVETISQAIAGADGIPIVQSAITALFVAVEAVVYVLMLVAINRQLSAQTVPQ